MRVSLITESFVPVINGVTNSVLRVLEHLEANGHEAMVIAPGSGTTEYAGAPVVRVPSVSVPGYQGFPLGLPTPIVLDSLVDFEPDVIHLASPLFLGAHGATLSKRLRIPSVAVFQTDVAGFLGSYHLGRSAGLLWRWMKTLHNTADLTLAPSTASCSELEERGFQRVKKWARGVDAARFNPAHRDEELRRQLAPNGEVIVGYVGRIAREKRVEQLCQLAGLPNISLVVVGDGPMRKDIEQRLPDAVFLGFRRGAELSAAFASLDIFVHVGPYETFCQSASEALASGVPVIAPAAGGLLDLVSPGKNGLLTIPPHSKGLREAVATLAANDTMRSRMALAAQLSTADRTWSAVGDELLAHYDDLVSNSPRRRQVA